MAVESGKLIKITNGTLTDADKVITNISFALNQTAINAEDNSRTSDTKEQYFRGILQNMMDYATSTSTCLRKGDIAFVDSIYDNFDDGSVDANIWTTNVTNSGTVTEVNSGETGYLDVSAEAANSTAEAIADDTANNAIDFQDGTDREVLINFEANLGGSTIIKLQVSDGSNHVDIINLGPGPSGVTARTTLRIVFDNVGQQCKAYLGLDDTSATTYDLSIPTNWYLRFWGEQNGAATDTCKLKVHTIGIADGSATSSTYTSEAQTLAITTTTGFTKVTEQLTTPAITLTTSFDNNSSSSTGNRLIVKPSGSGTQLVITAQSTAPASIAVASRNVQSLNDYYQLFYSA